MALSRRKHSLFFQILAGFTALAVIAIMVTGCICLFLYQRVAVTVHLEELASSIGGVAVSLSEHDAAPDENDILRMRDLTNSAIVFADTASGRTLVSDIGSFAWIDSLPGGDADLVRRVLEGEELSGVYRMEVLGGRMMLCGVPVLDGGGSVLGVVFLARPLSSILNDSGSFSIPLAAGAIAALLFSFITSLRLARLIARPVVRLEQAAAQARANSHVLRDVSGPVEVERLGVALHDLSERLERSIDSIAEERSRLEQVLGGIGEGLVAVDAAGRIIYHNHAARDLAGEDAFSANGEPSPLLSLLHGVIKDPQMRSIEWALSDGRIVEATARPITDEASGAVGGAVALLRDVSEPQRLEQMRRDYIANISHELRTPLTGIRGMVEPLMDGVIDGEAEKRESYRIIYQETVRLQKLIGDMLDMSRLQSNRVDFDLGPVEIGTMLQAARKRMSGQAADAGIRLETIHPSGALWCVADEDRVMQVLVILLDNALRFTPAGGTVTLFGRADGEWVAFGVRDTGAGIDPKDMPFIWERFFKADRSHCKKSGGTGLGLAIAKMAVEGMQGSIGAESSPGQGAIFTVRLRAREAPRE